jgi:twitching motility protein PilT
VRDCITNPEKTRQIREAISGGTSQYGMQTFDQSLYDLWAGKLITYEEALHQASNPDDFKLRCSGISSSADAARDQMQTAATRVKLDR